MVRIGLIVPVLTNFAGFAQLIQSVDAPVVPIVIPNWERNIGVSAGWNKGINLAIEKRCDLALVANDDIILQAGTISKLRAGVWNDGFDLVTPVNVRVRAATDRVNYIEEPDFACFMIEPERFVEKYGFFDEGFTPAYFEDNDMAYRIKVSGGTAFARTDAAMFHRGSVTQNWGGAQVVTGPMFENNKAYYVQKWGGEPGQEKFAFPFADQKRKVSDW